MIKIIHLCLLTFCLISVRTAQSQCTCRTNNWFATLSAGGSYNNPGYASSTRLATSPGNIYTVEITGSGCDASNVYLSITSGTWNGPFIACGPSPLSFTAAAGTHHFVHYYQNSSCGGAVGTGCRSGSVSGTQITFSLTSALSIELLSFSGLPYKEGNQLKWQTATEINNDFFELESTTNGNNFKTVGRIKGAGNSKEQQNYNFLDHTSEQITYYRLKQVDFDGSHTYHPIIMVEREKYGNEIMISPNPVTKTLYIDLNVGIEGNHNFSFINTLGASIEKSFMLATGNNRVEIDVSEELANGFYILRIADRNGMIINTSKLVKE